jgi:DNA-binding MarR family transcriptional regulator
LKGSLSLKSCEVELIGLGITMAARYVFRFFNKSLKDFGVTMTQAYVMYAISEYRGHTTSYIAKKLYVKHRALSECILLIKGYVKVHRHTEPYMDSRATYPALTRKGAAVLKKIMPKLIEIEKEIGMDIEGKEFLIKFIENFSTQMVKSTLRIKKEK